MNAATTTDTSTPDHAADTHGHGHHDERPSYDDINVPVVLLIGIISAILTFVTIWFVEGIYYHWNRSLVQERAYEVTNTRQNELLQQQRAVLSDGDEERNITSVDSAIPNVIARFGATSDSGDDHGSGDQGHSDEEGH